MTDTQAEFRQKHCPYSDGSGYRYEITVATRHDGELVIVIDATGGVVEIAAADWPRIGQSIDDAAAFVKSRTAD